MTNYITVVPAYGNDFKSKKDTQYAWDSGNDFKIATFGPDDGRYCSNSDTFPAGTVIMARYRKLTMITQVAKF